MGAAHTPTATNGSELAKTSGGNTTEIEQNAVSNAVSSASTLNYKTILDGFSEKGIPAEEIIPRVNVFTFHAWRGLGRCVRKGEHGVKVTTYIPRQSIDRSTGEISQNKFPTTTTVFHLSQTDPLPLATPAAEAA